MWIDGDRSASSESGVAISILVCKARDAGWIGFNPENRQRTYKTIWSLKNPRANENKIFWVVSHNASATATLMICSFTKRSQHACLEISKVGIERTQWNQLSLESKKFCTFKWWQNSWGATFLNHVTLTHPHPLSNHFTIQEIYNASQKL